MKIQMKILSTNLNRENSLVLSKEILKEMYSDLFIHMYESCRMLNHKLIRIGEVAKNIKDKSKEKWVYRFHDIVRKFQDEDYEQANREARDFIYDLRENNVRSTSLSLELYTIGIDAGIKAGNPDMSLLEEALSIADKDPTMLLRSFAIKIYELERNRLNDIRVKDVLDDICMTGREAEEKNT
jgi:hypothetical protein